MYQLIRTLPDGTEKAHSPVSTTAHAARAAGHVLADNAGVPKPEAQRFSASLARKALGTEWVHMGSGYRFRIERVGGGE